MVGIDANLDDLQSGLEACSRAAKTLQCDTTSANGLSDTSFHRSVVRHVEDLMACARDQKVAMQELREGVTRLQEELTHSNGAVRPPPKDRQARRRLRVR